MNTDLLLVLQTHSRADSQQYQKQRRMDERRFMGVTKAETALRCIRSLIASAQALYAKHPQCHIHLHIIDDHSDEAFLSSLRDILSRTHLQHTLVSLEARGIRENILACYEYGKVHGKELVYFVQDDYLYEESALWEMAEFYTEASKNIGAPVALYPYNDPYRYRAHNIVPVRIVQSPYRHWRTNYKTASCVMVHHDTLVREFDLFLALTQHVLDSDMEDDTINRLFSERGYFLFTPIPSLAFHMQYETERDPFFDYTPLWEKHTDAHTPHEHLFSGDEKKVLNIGAGTTPLSFSLFEGWREIRLDTEKSISPDIVAPITDMSAVPARTVDGLWASHIIEHVFWHELPVVFREIRRVLKDDGIAVLITPDLGTLGPYMKSDLDRTLYETSAGPIAALDMLYGYRGFTARGMTGMMHKIGFNAKLLHDALSTCGIQSVVFCARHELIAIIGYRPLVDNHLVRLYGEMPERIY